MKILELRFKNLNSLVGEWRIDFTADPYQAEGIYAIVGPTGAGKSTILDAICLALYGQTPRLGTINKSSNEIMSRQTAECFAEVVFSTASGTYLCHWSQYRARKKADGNLVQQSHEISTYPSGEILEEKSSRTPLVVEEKTGLSFNQFTRSILLAQGNFDSFLKADADKRAPILEQITGTEIYSQISVKVHGRWKAERERLESTRALAGNVTVLDQEGENELTNALQDTIKAEALVAQKVIAQNTICQWHRDLALNNKAQKELGLAQERLLEQQENFKETEKKIENADRAERIMPTYDKLCYLEKELATSRVSLANHQKAQGEKQGQEVLAKTESQKVEQLLTEQLEQEKALQPILIEVRKIDLLLQEKSAQIKTSQAEREDFQGRIAQTKKQLQDAKRGEEKLIVEHGAQELYLKEHSGDAILLSEFTAIKEKIALIDRTVEEGSRYRIVETRAKERMVQVQEQLELNRKKQLTEESSHKELLSKEAALKKQELELLQGQGLELLKAHRDSLFKETQYIAKIESLEAERERLLAGHPCPLCGALEHPYVTEVARPKLNEKEQALQEVDARLKSLEKIFDAYKALEKHLHQRELTLLAVKGELEKLAQQVEGVQRERQEAQAQLVEITARYKALEIEILSQLTHLKLTTLPANRIAFVNELETRRNRYKTAEDARTQFTLASEKFRTEIIALGKSLKEQGEFLERHNTKHVVLEKAFQQEQARRRELFGDKNPAQEAQKQQETIAGLQLKQQNAQAVLQRLVAELAKLEGNITQGEQLIQQLQSQEHETQKHFAQQLLGENFIDKNAFLDARMIPEQLTAAKDIAMGLKTQAIELQGRAQDVKQKREQLLETKSSDKAQEDDEQILVDLQKIHGEHQERLGRLKEKQEANENAKKKIAHFQEQMVAQEREFRVWEDLYNLIGSADGKKFRNFAQGLSFEIMVAHANRQLIKMNDRYLLIRDRDPKNPLGLKVVDNYQAGEERSTKNLSGGESFIISLALALGLSRMASQKVRVDSLFLDEGFGTLDSEALETALTALGNLHTEDKLIGIISHVPSLKERIPTQIEISPISGGRSQILGPGCSKIGS